MTSFADFGLAAPILQAISSEGYETPTPIQTQAIPHVLGGRDLCGIAQTGTGKTAAFALPILHLLSAMPRPRVPRACRVLVLSPTRELASQIADNFCAYGRQLRLSTAVVFGGVSLGVQQRLLAPGVDILVATPGRLLDLIDRRWLSLEHVQVLVLDEADRMLDLGFIHALRRIVKLLPSRRQTLLFSATMPRTIAALAEDYLSDPVKVAVTPVATTAERVEQEVVFVPAPQKQALLASLLEDPVAERVLVFTRTKHGADRVVRHLNAGGIDALAIHGNKSQPQRERALAGFRGGQVRVLVATDIAARGIDVDGISHVINFELPNVPEDYVHRIGRTARAGAGGNAISFCCDDERPYLRDIEKLTRLKIQVTPLPANLPPVERLPPQAQPAERSSRTPPRSAVGTGGMRHAPPRQAARNDKRPDAARHPRPAPAGEPRTAAENGDALPAFLRQDATRGPSSQGYWRHRNGSHRKAPARPVAMR